VLTAKFFFFNYYYYFNNEGCFCKRASSNHFGLRLFSTKLVRPVEFLYCQIKNAIEITNLFIVLISKKKFTKKKLIKGE